ncbi:Hypothetical predicted protein [Octopus vulgaris]|uniref:Uncharacterized protein n=1 Tax=Octopus vulgaris TaxID=6645 RepID=A0AA36BI94_OCTVU|nr:Hypothetical predicted protein [Octopus vulgaris]
MYPDLDSVEQPVPHSLKISIQSFIHLEELPEDKSSTPAVHSTREQSNSEFEKEKEKQRHCRQWYCCGSSEAVAACVSAASLTGVWRSENGGEGAVVGGVGVCAEIAD